MMEESLSFWPFSFTIVLPRLVDGILVTLKLTFLSGSLGLILGMILALLRLSPFFPFKVFATAYVTFFRGTPLLLQLLFIYFALPVLINVTLDSFPAGVLALSLNAAAYLAEIFRSAIESIPHGQKEAGWALGLSEWQTMRQIIIPQTYRRIIPPLVNEFAALTKETALVSVISLPELLFMTQRLGAKYLRPWEVYIWAALGYLLVVMSLSMLAHFLEKKLARKGE
ncbi:MAG: amino acid ABC transporter permease [Bacteriovoracaceae bacterium]|nr:amino acid ABC transporter permease [Bacteriovoracaceae bacterium]